MNRQARRAQLSEARRHLRAASAAHTDALAEVPRSEWPPNQPEGLVAVFRSRRFLVQLYSAQLPAVSRITVCRTALENSGRWQAGITWEELQGVKNALGFESFDAVEVYPRREDEVTDCNMRHLWIMGEPLAFAWRNE